MAYTGSKRARWSSDHEGLESYSLALPARPRHLGGPCLIPPNGLNAALEGRYLIERELGEGGMATVYLAEDLKHERRVAIKVLKSELAAVVGAERFLAETIRAASSDFPC